MKKEYENCSANNHIKPSELGKHFHPEKLSTTKNWLAASKQLEQGISSKEKKEVDDNFKEYEGSQWLRLIKLYDKKIDVNSLNNQRKNETDSIWNFYEDGKINKLLNDFNDQFLIDKNPTDYKYEDLGILNEKVSIEIKNTKETKKRPRGFYIYKLNHSEEINVFIVHSNENSNKFSFEPNEEGFSLLNNLINTIGIINKNPSYTSLMSYKLLIQELEVKKFFQEKKGVKFFLTYSDLKFHLYRINLYLDQFKNSFELSSDNDFLNLSLKIYNDRCQKESDSHCLTNIRCIIDDIMTIQILVKQYEEYVFKKNNLENELSNIRDRLKVYYHVLNQMYESDDINSWNADKLSEIFKRIKLDELQTVDLEKAKNLFENYCQKNSIGLYSSDSDPFEKHGYWLSLLCDIENIYKINSKTVDYKKLIYFLSYLRDANHKGCTKFLVENEISKQIDNLDEISNQYQAKRLKHSAYHMVNKRVDLYKIYNGIRFICLFNNKFPDFKFLTDGDQPDQIVKRITQYKDILDKILFKPIRGFSEIYTLLRLICRSGEKFDEETKKKLLENLGKNKKYQELSCEDICFTDENWDHDNKPLHYESPSVHFFCLGNRVVGVNNNSPDMPLYVYDYGSTKDTFAQEYQKFEEKNEETIEKLKNLKKSIYDHHEYIDTLIKWYEEFVKENINSKPIIGKIFINDAQLDFNDFEGIRKIIEKESTVFSQENFRIEHIENIFLNYIMHKLFFSIKFNIEHSIEIDKLKDTKTVTYPQICLKLPNMSASDFAKYMRNLLKGEIKKVDDKFRYIPILTAAWFLSETGRNPVTFMITLMMLDLMEKNLPYNTNHHSKKYYDLHNIVWDHSILNNDLLADKREEQYPQKEGWGGKHPMCHSGSFIRLFKKDQFPEIEPLLGQVRQKEGTILINWLTHAIKQKNPTIETEIITLHNKSQESATLKKSVSFFTYNVVKEMGVTKSNKEKSEIIEKTIKPLLKKRLNNFDSQISPMQPKRFQISFFEKYSREIKGGAIVAATTLAIVGFAVATNKIGLKK